MKLNCQVDGVNVTIREARAVVKYLIKHRKEYKDENDVRVAFDSFIRKMRGGENNA